MKNLIISGFVFMLASCSDRGEKLFRSETQIDLPNGPVLIFSKKDKTESAYVWEFPNDIKSFELPSSLNFEGGANEWVKPWFGYFGELDKSKFGKNMKFRVFRTSTARVAVGKDVIARRIAFSWINID